MRIQTFVSVGAPLLLTLCLAGSACSSRPPPSHPEMLYGREQQAIVDRPAEAVRSLREDARFAGSLEHLLAQAHGVLIFPRLVKASVIFGGEGGNGVMVARRPDGS